jgi:hypothetical protein
MEKIGKRGIWSAFAMSLWLFSFMGHTQTESIDDFLGLEQEIMPDLKGPQDFTPANLHQRQDWNVTEKEVINDITPLKGQNHSLIPWETQNPENWLSIDNWLIERSLKDKNPDWAVRLRDERHQELVGKVLVCRGQCDVYRGINKASVQHLSRIHEGDELKTAKDSHAWVFIMDGTLTRVGPESSVSFKEINWSEKEVFHLVRLNQGHLYWHPSDTSELPIELAPETDTSSIPLLIREANEAFFERHIFKTQSDRLQLDEVLKLEENAIKLQFEKLNTLKGERKNQSLPVSRVMMVAPNGTIVSQNTAFDFISNPGSKAFFKKRSVKEGAKMSLHLRGYTQTKNFSIDDEEWHEVTANGRSYDLISQPAGELQLMELLTRRIKTLELAREIWIKEFTFPVVQSLQNQQQLAVQHGYFLWGDELHKRFDFLVEYTRRVETSNLKAMDNLMARLEQSGEKSSYELGDSYYRYALKHYVLGLKNRYTNQRMQVREMNDLQYYIWILKHAQR